MDWCFFKSQQGKKQFQTSQGRWYFKQPKNRPDFVFSPHRQLEDLWSQVCALHLAKLVGIHVPEVYMVIPMYWYRVMKDSRNHARISASLFSYELKSFTELSTFYKTLQKLNQPFELYDRPELLLEQLSYAEKLALGQLYATALWLGHWDLANNIDFANAGFYQCPKTNQLLPVLIDGGNALDEGFHGYTKFDTISLFARQNSENRINHNQDDFETRRFGYEHLSPLNDKVYPFLPRFLFDQKKLFWTDPAVVSGFVKQAAIIAKIKRVDLKDTIRQCWHYVVDADGVQRKQPAAVLKYALKKNRSRWYPGPSNKEILDDLMKRAKHLTVLAKKIEGAATKDATAIDNILVNHCVQF